MLFCVPDGDITLGRLGHNCQPRVGLHNVNEPLPEKRMIIDDE